LAIEVDRGQSKTRSKAKKKKKKAQAAGLRATEVGKAVGALGADQIHSETDVSARSESSADPEAEEPEEAGEAGSAQLDAVEAVPPQLAPGRAGQAEGRIAVEAAGTREGGAAGQRCAPESSASTLPPRAGDDSHQVLSLTAPLPTLSIPSSAAGMLGITAPFFGVGLPPTFPEGMAAAESPPLGDGCSEQRPSSTVVVGAAFADLLSPTEHPLHLQHTGNTPVQDAAALGMAAEDGAMQATSVAKARRKAARNKGHP
jgi:hypothetical protein